MIGPIVLQPDDSLARGIEGAGSALAAALEKRNERKRRRESLSPFQQVLENTADPKMPRLSLHEAYAMAINNNADPAEAAMQAQMYMNFQEKEAFGHGVRASSEFGGIGTTEGRQAFLKKYSESGGDLKSVVKMLESPKAGKQTIFEKKFDEFKANSVISVLQGGNKATQVDEQLNWLESNAENVGKLRGLVNQGFMQNPLYAEYENRGNLILPPVIEIFNKSGALPTHKLNWIRDQFAISPYMTQDQIQGKINGFRPLVKAGANFEKGVKELINKYGEDIPNNEFIKRQQELSDAFDAVYKAETGQKKETAKKEFEKLPDPSTMPGKTVRHPKTGQRLKSNGTRWIDIS